jgi:non-ribosomal peptide synthetase component F
LFDQSTVIRFVDHFRELLKSVVADPDQRLDELQLLDKEEERVLLVDWNDTAAEFPETSTAYALFEAQAQRTPDAVAVVHGQQQLTYRELDDRTNRLARHLKDLGLGPDLLAGVCMERSVQMLVSVLGVLKAGGAYVPLAPETPAERAAFMLEETQARIVLTQESLLEQLGDYPGRLVCVDRDWSEISRHGAGPFCPRGSLSAESGRQGGPQGSAGTGYGSPPLEHGLRSTAERTGKHTGRHLGFRVGDRPGDLRQHFAH